MIIVHITEKLIQIQMRGKGEVLCILLDGFNHMLSRAVYSQHAVGITGRIQNYASQRGDLRFYSLLQRPVLIARHNKRAVHGGISYVNARAVVFDLVENTGKQHASHLVGSRIYEDAVRQPKLAHSLCNGHLVQRRSRYGKTFHSCDRYPECQFAINFKPIAGECPECHYPLLIEKKTAQGVKHFCASKQCGKPVSAE